MADKSSLPSFTDYVNGLASQPAIWGLLTPATEKGALRLGSTKPNCFIKEFKTFRETGLWNF